MDFCPAQPGGKPVVSGSLVEPTGRFVFSKSMCEQVKKGASNSDAGLPRIPSSASSRLMSALVEQYMKSRSRTHVSSTRRNLSVKSTLRGGLLSLTGERVKKNVRTHISAAEMVTFGESKPNLARSMLKALVLLHGQEEALNMLVAELTLQRLKAFLIVAFPGAIIAKAKPSKLALAEEILRCSSRYELVETSSE